MNSLKATLIAEYMKLRRSKITWIIFSLFIFIPLMMSIMVYVTMKPEIGAKMGMIGTKASLLRFGNADWTSYFSLINQTVAAIGLVGFGFVTSWIFGREYSDRTMKDLLALPVHRSTIVISKFIIVFILSALLAVVLCLAAIIFGLMIHIPGWSVDVILQNVLKFAVISFYTILLCTPVAFLAGYGRGFLLPVGFIILTLIIANFIGLVGLGPYFPWAIPGIFSTSASEPGLHLVPASYFILIFTCIAGFAGTVLWWRYADQH